MSSLWSATGSLFKRFRLFVLVLMCWALAMEAKTPVIRRHHGNDTKALIYVSIALIVFLAVLVLGYIARELCPRGPIFTSLELDEIRLDHLDDIESSLKQNINALKDKLAYHRKKKTQVQTDRDIKRRLGERVEKFNDKGRSIYGEAWDEGDIPVKAVVAMTTKEVQELRRDAEHIVEQRKQEEKEDLWKLWNDMRQDGGGKSQLSSSPDANFNDKQALLQRANNDNNKKYVHTGTASIAESIYKMQNNVTIDNNINVNSYNNSLQGNRNTLRQQNNNHFERSNNSKFSSPVKQPQGTYNYNNTSYGYADNDAEQSQGLLKPQASPGSAIRLQPPILDLSKLTTAPAHIKPPPNKPPSYQPTAQTTNTSNPMNSYPMSGGNPLLSRPSAGGPPGAGGPQRGPPMSGAQSGPQSVPGTAPDRESMRPSMRSYAPGKRPPPPAGPKPAALTNSITTGSDKYSAGTGTNNPLHVDPSANAGFSSGVSGNDAAGSSSASVGPPGVRSMKRPPPPMMAPPGYVPGNSRRGSGSAKNSARASFNNDDKEH